MLFQFEKWLLWIPHQQHHCFSNWRKMFCEIYTSTIVAFLTGQVAFVNSASTESSLFYLEQNMFCEIQTSTIVGFLIRKMNSVNSVSTQSLFSNWNSMVCEIQTNTIVAFLSRKVASVNSVFTASLLFQLERHVLRIPDEHNRCFSKNKKLLL